MNNQPAERCLPTSRWAPDRQFRKLLLLAAASLTAIGFWCYWDVRVDGVAVAHSPPEEHASKTHEVTKVRVVIPSRGEMDRISDQPGSVQAFESASLFSGVPGYLKSQTVDIGDRVKQGQVLAIVDVPDLEKQVQRNHATVEQCRARVGQMQARVNSARAELDVTNAEVVHSEATAKSKAADSRFRQRQLDRMKELLTLKSVDERLVDEKTEQRDAAEEAENAAKAAVVAAKAHVTAANAKIQQAEADLKEAEAEVKVAQADLEKSQVLVSYATVRAPFDGVITHRSMFPGDYVRTPSTGGQTPLLTVERTDRMRVVVQVPDRDVPYVDEGDTAEIEIDALPGKRHSAKVSRLARTEDPQSRLMRVEIDLPNPTGKICQGMYGRVRLILERSEMLSIPSPCIVSRTADGKATIYVVKDGKAKKVKVQVAADNGLRVGIASGLAPGDQVIMRPPEDLADGAAVVADAPSSTASH